MARGATGAVCLRLLLDEHFSPEIARQLRRLGHDVAVRARDQLLRELPDANAVANRGVEVWLS